MEIEIKKVNLSAIKINSDNPRIISQKAMEYLVKSLQTFPEMMQLREIVVDETMTILGGNMRYLALQKIKVKECFAKIVTGLTSEQKREFVVKDNANFGEWNFDALANSWSEMPLAEWGVNLPENWLDNMGNKLTDPDDVPDILENVESITKRGDLYLLGKHRVLCGDATNTEDIKRLMDGKKIDMVFTDPPYGVSYASKNKFLNAIDKGNQIQIEIENDHMTLEKTGILWANTFKVWTNYLNEYHSYYICSPQCGDLFLLMIMMMNENGFPLRHTIIWAKNNHVLGRTDYNYKHEPILYGWNTKHKFYGNGEQRFSVWNYDKPLKNDLHPTMKPVDLIINAILNSTQGGNNIVADMFLGSGSTLIACEKINRICYGMEIDPHYCDVIVKRWENFTGEKAEK